MAMDRVYCDEAGDSHVDRVEVQLAATNYAPPAPPLDVSTPQSAERVVFFHAPAGWTGDFHSTPRRQIYFGLAGELEVTVSDGQVLALPPGSTVLFEDTEGKGHFTKVVGDTAVYGAFVHLE